MERLTAGPWQAGRLRLTEAALPSRSPEAVEALIRGAADNFRDAAPLQPDGSFARAFVVLDLALSLAFLGDTTASRYYAERAYLVSRKAMWIATERHRRTRRAELTAARSLATRVTTSEQSNLLRRRLPIQSPSLRLGLSHDQSFSMNHGSSADLASCWIIGISSTRPTSRPAAIHVSSCPRERGSSSGGRTKRS